jgi:hypothetical protein
MSRKLTVILLVMVILTGAMGLKAVVTSHSNGTVMIAAGGGPVPPSPWKAGGGPVPPSPWKAGGGPVPPSPW